MPHGEPDAIAARVSALRAAGADHVVISDLGGRTRVTARALAPLLLR